MYFIQIPYSKKLIWFEAKSKKLKERKRVKHLEQRKKKAKTVARKLLDGATAAEYWKLGLI